MKRISLAVLIVFSICLFACKSYKDEFNIKKTELNKEKEISKGKDALISGLEAEKNRLNAELIKLGETAKALEKEKALLLERIIKLTNDYSSSKEDIIKLQSTQNILEEKLSQSANEKAALLVQQAKLEADLLSVKDEALRKLTIDQLIKIFEANIKLIGNAGSDDLKLVTAKLKAIETREKAVLTAEELLKTKRDILDADTKKLENSKIALAAESASLSKRENDLNSLQTSLDKQKADLDARENVSKEALAKYQKDVEILKKSKETFEKDKLIYDVKIKELETSVKVWEAKCSEKEKSFIAKDAELKKIKQELDSHKNDLAAEKLKTLNLNNNIVELNNTIKLKEKELAAEKEKANNAGVENIKKIKELETVLNELRTEKSALDIEIKKLKEKIVQSEAAKILSETRIVGLQKDIQILEKEKSAWGKTRESLELEIDTKVKSLKNEMVLLNETKALLEAANSKHAEESAANKAKIAELEKKIAAAETSKKFYISKEVWLKRNSIDDYTIGEIFDKDKYKGICNSSGSDKDCIAYRLHSVYVDHNKYRHDEWILIGINKKTKLIYKLEQMYMFPSCSFGFRGYSKELSNELLFNSFVGKFMITNLDNLKIISSSYSKEYKYVDDHQQITLISGRVTITNFAVQRGEEPLYTK